MQEDPVVQVEDQVELLHGTPNVGAGNTPPVSPPQGNPGGVELSRYKLMVGRWWRCNSCWFWRT